MSRRAIAVLAVAAAALACSDPSTSDRACAFVGLDALARCAATSASPVPGPGPPGTSRTLFRPGALAAGALDLELEAGERAAIFLLNVAGRDGATARLESAGVAAPAVGEERQAISDGRPIDVPGDAGVLELTRTLLLERSGTLQRAATSASTTPGRTTFCVLSSASYGVSARREGRLVAEGLHARVYVDEAEGAGVTADEASRLARAFDERIHPSLTAILGPPSDVDGDGKVILFLTQLPELWGYYWASDVVLPRDASASCDGTRSNAIDAVYLALPSAVTRAGFTRAEAIDDVLPGVLAHEYAHLLSFQRRCLARTCRGADETWIEEGIAKVAEDEAGYGWHRSRAAGAAYLARTRLDARRGYDGRSLTRWEGDVIGNYEGAHAFFRLHADRLGRDILAALTSGRTGIANVEQALGMPFPEALADFATALLFSDVPAPPGAEHGFSGAAWTPLRDKLRTLETVPLGDALPAAASLRTDGWNAFLTGEAGAGGGTVRVTSPESVKPWVAVVRFRGEP